MQPHSLEFKPGTVVDGTYRILSRLGRGGMGTIYLCEHLILDKEYALKTLSCGSINEIQWRRFQTEARVISKLSHPNIVEIHNMGIFQDQPYYVMDVLIGESLQELIAETGALSVSDGLRIIMAVCDGLQCAHDHGVIHRDIKPSNIMLIQDESKKETVVKLVDFGLVKTVGDQVQRLTATGEIIGSPYYMSPEQTEGKTLDFSSDLYSLGVTLVETLTGSVPFRGSNAVQTLMMHQSTQPPTLAELAPDKIFSAALEEVVATLLAKDPRQRYQSCKQLQKDLKQIINQLSSVPDKVRLNSKKIGFNSSSSGDSASDTAGGTTESRRLSRSGMAIAAACLFCMVTCVILFSGIFKAPAKLRWQTEHDIYYIASEAKKFDPQDGEDVEIQTDKDDFKIDPVLAAIPVKNFLIASDEKGRTFSFPTSYSLGKFDLFTPRGVFEVKPDTSGFLFVPKDSYLLLSVTSSLRSNPALLKGFGHSDLNGIGLQNCRHGAGIMLKAIGHMSDLGYVDLSRTDCLGKDLLALKSMTKIHSLKINQTNIPPEDLKNLPCFENLHLLEYRFCKFPQKLVEVICRQKRLDNLVLDDTELSVEDCSNLGRMKQLTSLSLAHCSLKAAHLKALRSLPNLAYLQLKNQILEADCVAPLLQLPAQARIEVDDTQDWSAEQRKRLTQSHKNLIFVNHINFARPNDPALKNKLKYLTE